MLFDGLTVVANPCRLLSEPSFKAFVSPIVDERGTFGEGQDLEAVIMEVSVNYRLRSLRAFARGVVVLPRRTHCMLFIVTSEPDIVLFYVNQQDTDFQEMLECIHRNVAHSFRRTETYASSFDTLTQCYLENAQFARDVSVR